MNRQTAALSLLCALGCAPVHAAGAPPLPMTRRIVLLVDEIKAIRNFPVVVAERLGYLKGDGMDVTVMNTRNEVPHADMLADGRVDAVMAYYHHNIVSQSEGRYSEAVVTLGVTPGAKVLVANRVRDKYRNPEDLKGSRIIAGGAGSSKTTLANYLVLAGGGRIGDYVRLATGGLEKNAAALRDGTADFVVAPTPDADYYLAHGVATVFADLTTVDGTRKSLRELFPSSTVFMNSERVKEHPEIAQHLANAFVRTLGYINSHSAEEIAALIPEEVSGKDRAAYLAVLKQELPMFANDGRMPAGAAEKELGVLAAFNPKYAAVRPALTYTNVFVDAALAAQVRH
jgi:NitT/TauT family transport system substrate-binding protein